jgi:hypothetical protein
MLGRSFRIRNKQQSSEWNEDLKEIPYTKSVRKEEKRASEEFKKEKAATTLLSLTHSLSGSLNVCEVDLVKRIISIIRRRQKFE